MPWEFGAFVWCFSGWVLWRLVGGWFGIFRRFGGRGRHDGAAKADSVAERYLWLRARSGIAKRAV